MTPDEDSEQVGYRLPPRLTRFAKGQSGNPKGRQKGTTCEIPYEAALGQKVAIREDGVERKVTAAQAFLLHLAKRGLEGDDAAIRATLAALDLAAKTRPSGRGQNIDTIVLVAIAPGNPNSALVKLRMAAKLDRFRPSARTALEPWLVEAALARLGDKHLSLAEQIIVMQATRTPHKVNWPTWWKAEG